MEDKIWNLTYNIANWSVLISAKLSLDKRQNLISFLIVKWTFFKE